MEKKSKLKHEYLEGLRLFHFFFTDEIVNYAKQKGLTILTDIKFRSIKMEKAIFTYFSGKRIPTAAMFFQKV